MNLTFFQVISITVLLSLFSVNNIYAKGSRGGGGSRGGRGSGGSGRSSYSPPPTKSKFPSGPSGSFAGMYSSPGSKGFISSPSTSSIGRTTVSSYKTGFRSLKTSEWTRMKSVNTATTFKTLVDLKRGLKLGGYGYRRRRVSTGAGYPFWNIYLLRKATDSDDESFEEVQRYICPVDPDVFPEDDIDPDAIYDSFICNNYNSCPEDIDECMFEVLETEMAEASKSSVKSVSLGFIAIIMGLLFIHQ